MGDLTDNLAKKEALMIRCYRSPTSKQIETVQI